MDEIWDVPKSVSEGFLDVLFLYTFLFQNSMAMTSILIGGLESNNCVFYNFFLLSKFQDICLLRRNFELF